MVGVGRTWGLLVAVLIPCSTGFGLLLGPGAVPAAADTYVFDLTTGNSGGLGLGPGPYAQVTVDLMSSTTARITFDSLMNGGYIYLMGDGKSAGVNVNASSFTLGGVSGTNSLSGFSPGPYVVANPPGASTVDGFGLFNGAVDSFDGFTHSATEINFTLTDTGGTWGSAAQVLALNAGGNLAEIHGFACPTSTQTPCTSSTGAAFTGFGAGISVVPEPATLLLVGAGFVALPGYGLIRRRPKKVERGGING